MTRRPRRTKALLGAALGVALPGGCNKRPADLQQSSPPPGKQP